MSKKFNTTPSVVIRIVIWIVMLLGGAYYSISADIGSELFGSVLFHVISALLGIGVIRLAFNAAAKGGKELTKGRVGDIPRLETNKLVTSGIYECMRHPMLFGLMLLPLGWALLLGSVTFITVVAPLEMVFIALMVLIFEEMEIKSKFGKEYEAYRQKVPMVSFDKRCLRELFCSRDNKISIKPIGYIHSPFCELVDMPVQPKGAKDIQATITIEPEYVDGLKDLDGFSHLYLIYHFHKVKSHKLQVVPFNDKTNTPRGVFATRTPMHPNSLGLSVVELVSVEGDKVTIRGVDILDGTPIIDIKPYIANFDKVEGDSKSGWMKASQEEVSLKKSDDRFVQ
jgi:tRNA-Thr(GGU) m(6)t(6)A37 methyltransferase TsaA